MKFQVTHTDGAARTGRLETAHGVVETPIFMPVGTVGAVKAVAPDDLRTLGAQIVLGNTYHLYLRPGAETVASHGGLQQFSAWRGPMLTDSGGFQIYSLGRGKAEGKLASVSDQGALFRSHIDGSEHLFTPERVMRIEQQLGADIIMPLDDVPPADCHHAEASDCVARSSRWLEQQAAVWRARLDADKQALFGIIQGGSFADLRQQSARAAASLDLPGYALGGLSAGKPYSPNLWLTVAETCALLPTDKPRYLMGFGEPETILEAFALGVDMMDCVLPTRLARHGAVWRVTAPAGRHLTPGEWLAALMADGGHGWQGRRIDLGQARYLPENGPLMPGCDCYTCTTFQLGTLSHYVRIKEPLAMRLLSVHNLAVLFALERAAKQAIVRGQFQALLTTFRQVWQP